MTQIAMDGKKKRKSDISSPEVGEAKTSFSCGQGICVNYSDEEDDGVHGGRMKPLASLEVNQHLLQGRGFHGGFANSTLSKKIVSPSAVTAAAKITARAREKARMCLLDENKENAFPNATGFRPFRGTKRKGASEGSHPTALQAVDSGSPGKILDARKFETEKGIRDGSGGTGAHVNGGAREHRQFVCMSNSAWSEPSDVQTVSVQVSQFPNSNRLSGTDALSSESVLQSSQESSNPLLLAPCHTALKHESIATPLHVARSVVENSVHGSRETSTIGPQHAATLQKTDVDNSQTSTTTLRPEAHPRKLGPSSLRQIRNQVPFGRMQLSSSTSTSKNPSPGRRCNGKPNATDRASYHGSVSPCQNLLPSKLVLPRNGDVAPAARASDQSPCNLSRQHVTDVPKPEISGHSTITVRVNPNLARQSSCMSSSQSLPPTGRKPRVFKSRSDSSDGEQRPCLQNLGCKDSPGLQEHIRVTGDQKGTPGRVLANTGLNGKLLPHPSRLTSRYLSLPPRQGSNNRPRKTGYSKFRPTSLDSAKDLRKDSKKPVESTEPAGLLGEFNPGIFTRIRDCKQVHAILGAVVGSEAMEATASFRLHRKQEEEQRTSQVEVSFCERTKACEGIVLPSRLNEPADDKHGVNTASANGTADSETGHSQAVISSCDHVRGNSQPPSLSQDYQPACDPPKADFATGHPGIPGTGSEGDDEYETADPFDAARSVGQAFLTDPKKSDTVANVACRWLELVGMDIKGRLAALKRSRRRFRNVVCSGELDVEVPLRGEDTELQPQQHGLQDSQWKTLFMNMDGMLSLEGGKLESSLKQVTEMQVNCRQALEYACNPSTSGLAPSERKKRDMVLAASAASIFSAANFASMICN